MSGRSEGLWLGQLWCCGAYLYAIDDLDGPDACYPIVMREVARTEAERARIEAAIAAMPPVHQHYRTGLREPRDMQQERAWFDSAEVAKAHGVRPWSGSIDEWRAVAK